MTLAELTERIREDLGYLGEVSGVERVTYTGRPCVRVTFTNGADRQTYNFEVTITKPKAANDNG